MDSSKIEMDSNKIGIILVIFFISCGGSKDLMKNECIYEYDQYEVIKDIQDQFLIKNYIIHEQFLNINDFKNSDVVEEYLLEYFDFSEAEYHALHFTQEGMWCAKYLTGVRFSKSKKSDKINIISYPILIKKINKAFIIRYTHGMHTLILLEKIKGKWEITNDHIISMSG